MTLGDFITRYGNLPASTPLIIAQFDASPHASPQYWGVGVLNTQYQNMQQIGAWWHNPLDPATDAGEGLPKQLVIFLNPQFPQEQDS